MIKFSSDLLCEFEIENEKVDLEYENLLQTSEKAFNCCMESIEKLKQYLVSNGFKNEQEEIQFFKHIKPKFTSQIIFYREVHTMESYKPDENTKRSIRYFEKQLKKLKDFSTLNADFIRYYTIGNTCMDNEYFVRNRFDIKNNPDMSFYEYDPAFTTSQGNKIAVLLANKKLKTYIENKIKYINKSITDSNQKDDHSFDLSWTGSKTNAVELIYAIHGTKSINQGKITIKEMVRAFEIILKIDLRGYSRLFMNIKARDNPPQYIDILNDSILNYVVVSDNHNH